MLHVGKHSPSSMSRALLILDFGQILCNRNLISIPETGKFEGLEIQQKLEIYVWPQKLLSWCYCWNWRHYPSCITSSLWSKGHVNIIFRSELVKCLFLALTNILEWVCANKPALRKGVPYKKFLKSQQTSRTQKTRSMC